MYSDMGREEVGDGISRAPHCLLKYPVPGYMHNAIAGAASGAVSRMVTAPFDVAKIRYQLDHRSTPRYNKSLWAVIRSIYGEEGLVSLWRGNVPAMLLWACFSGVQFSTYDQLRTLDLLRHRRHDGADTGAVKLTVSLPSLLSDDNSNKRGPGYIAGTRHAGFRDADNSSHSGGTYIPGDGSSHSSRKSSSSGGGGGYGPAVKDSDRRGVTVARGGWQREVEEGQGGGEASVGGGYRNGVGLLPDAVCDFVYGAIAGAVATVVSYPFDITRTALACQGVPKRYGNMEAFVTRTLREAGPRGFFRGMSPALLMITPQMGVNFAVYERIKSSKPTTTAITTIYRASDSNTSDWSNTKHPVEYCRGRTAAAAQKGADREGVPLAGVGAGGKEMQEGQQGEAARATTVAVMQGQEQRWRIGQATNLAHGGGGEEERGRGGNEGESVGPPRRRKAEEKEGEQDLSRLLSLSSSTEMAWPMVAGAVAGITSKLVVLPLDMVKKRVQTEVMLSRDVAYGVLPKYNGPIHALRTIVNEEGCRALFRGSVPAIWKSGFSTALTFAVYEWVKKGLGGMDD